MKKKIFVILGIILIVIIAAAFITNYADSARVTTGHEPKYCIKVISDEESKITYYGLGYKVIRYVGVSPNEPYESNIGVKMGNWFMKYDLPEDDEVIDIKEEQSFYGKIIEATDSYIIVEPNEDEEERKSADKISIALGEYNDALYMVGTNVKITYDGIIKESYPAQVKASRIEIKSTENYFKSK